MEDDFEKPNLPAEAYRYNREYVDRDGFQCIRCGHCCTEMIDGYCFSIDDDQFDYWVKNKPSLLNWIRNYEGWVNPRTGEDVNACPWYRVQSHSRYKLHGPVCLIQKHKPAVCRNFPLSVLHAIDCFCRGFAHLSKDELIIRIQKEVDKHQISLRNAKYPPQQEMIQFIIDSGLRAKQRVLNDEYTMEYTRHKYEQK